MKVSKSLFAKALALCLTLVLTISLAVVPVSAKITDKQTTTITVQGLETDKDTTVDIYKVMNVNFDILNQQPKEPVYVWASEVADWLKKTGLKKPEYSTYIDTTDNAVTEAFSKLTGEKLSAFYKELQAAILNNTIKLSPAHEQQTINAETNYKVDFTVEMGQYLVVPTAKDSNYSPAVANVFPTFNEETKGWELNPVTVNIKGSKSSIGKDVTNNDTTVAVGDKVNYRLDVVIPSYPADTKTESIRFEVADILSKGLTFNKKDFVVKVGGADPAKATDVEDTYYELVTDGAQINVGGVPTPATFVVKINGQKFIDFKTKYPNDTHLYVEYSATVNENAFETDALGNKAYVGTNDPYTDESHEPGVDKEVYTYGIDIKKVDEGNNALTGAEFKLYRDKNAKKEIKFIKTGEGVYRLAKDGEEGTADSLVVNSNGKLQLQGLDLGDYYLKETKAPAGYNLLKDVYTLTLADDDKDGILNGDADKNNILDETAIVNTKGFQLPTTGGMGTIVFTVVGMALMAGGIILIIAMRKKSTNK